MPDKDSLIVGHSESEARTVTITMTPMQAQITRDALNAWADSRMKIARRRDRKERHLTGVSIERSLAEFFAECRAARGYVVDGIESARRAPAMGQNHQPTGGADAA